MLHNHYSAIRFQAAPETVNVDIDALALECVASDIKEWLEDHSSKQDEARAAVMAMRSDWGFTPFSMAKYFGVPMVELMEILR